MSITAELSWRRKSQDGLMRINRQTGRLSCPVREVYTASRPAVQRVFIPTDREIEGGTRYTSVRLALTTVFHAETESGGQEVIVIQTSTRQRGITERGIGIVNRRCRIDSCDAIPQVVDAATCP